MPSMGADMTEGTIVKWLKNEGDKVSKGDKLAEIETDKTVVEMESYNEGILKKILVKEGTKIGVGKTIAYIGDLNDAVPENGLSEEKQSDNEEEPEKLLLESTTENLSEEVVSVKNPQKITDIKEDPDNYRIKASPMAKKLANEKSIHLEDIIGTGPGGRITKDDVNNYVPGPRLVSSSSIGVKKTTILESSDIPLNSMRQAIAKVTVRSKTEKPHFQVTVEIDMTEAMKTRKDINEISEKDKIKISVNDLVLKATINSLIKYPKWNSFFDGEKLTGHSSINLGIAIALDQGLIVPAILDSQNLDLFALSIASKSLGKRARGDGENLTNDELTGATFSTSNLGMFGTHSFTAIIVPPQSGIIALGTVKKEPKVINDQILVREIMYATLSADHRVGDGAEGAIFMNEFKQNLEKPTRLLL
jgi:pyruvate dehydrogenase E2 component (dihydrolipoamide acetyltransferase)